MMPRPRRRSPSTTCRGRSRSSPVILPSPRTPAASPAWWTVTASGWSTPRRPMPPRSSTAPRGARRASRSGPRRRTPAISRVTWIAEDADQTALFALTLDPAAVVSDAADASAADILAAATGYRIAGDAYASLDDPAFEQEAGAAPSLPDGSEGPIELAQTATDGAGAAQAAPPARRGAALPARRRVARPAPRQTSSRCPSPSTARLPGRAPRPPRYRSRRAQRSTTRLPKRASASPPRGLPTACTCRRSAASRSASTAP